MTLIWKVRRIPLDEAMEGSGVWEPFGAVEDIEGEEFIYVKAQVDVETSEKSSEVSGGLKNDW